MFREAQRAMEDARALSESPAASPMSSNAYLLGLLGFELLLKIVYEAAIGKAAPKHHRYSDIFRALPISVRRQTLKAARQRIGPSALGRRHYAVLKDLGDNFVNLRYPFEKYANLTEADYAKRNADWAAKGAKVKDADFRYHPEPLFGLIEALRAIVAKLDAHSYDWTASRAAP